MFEYRVTKYDPKKRNADGHYLAEEWIMYSQVGEYIDGHLLTIEEYLQIEKAYLDAAMGMLNECGIEGLVVRGLENHARHKPALFELRNDAPVSLESLRETMTCLLRGNFWCRLEHEDGAFIHVGWDYYMYVGLPCEPSHSIEEAHANGLFVEAFESPYKVNQARTKPCISGHLIIIALPRR